MYLHIIGFRLDEQDCRRVDCELELHILVKELQQGIRRQLVAGQQVAVLVLDNLQENDEKVRINQYQVVHPHRLGQGREERQLRACKQGGVHRDEAGADEDFEDAP